MYSIEYAGSQVTPSKIVCVGRNYVEHIRELGNELPEEMVIFLKPNSSISTVLRATHHHEELHYEAEICYLVQNQRLAAIACGLDLTKRDLQSRLKTKGLPWERAKAFDGAALFSPFVALAEPAIELGIELRVDDIPRQQGTTAMMIHSPARILAELSTFMTLEDGDILMTGTPAGVGRVRSGEVFEALLLAGGECLTSGRWQAL